MIKTSLDVLKISSGVLNSMLRHPERLPERSWSTEFTGRLAQRMLETATEKSDKWLRDCQSMIAMRGPALAKVRSESLSYGSVSCLQCVPRRYKATEQQPATTIMYFHGGGYVVGSAKGYHYMLAKLALECDARVIGVDYRLAPEFPLPCAQEDCLQATESVLEKCGPNERLILMGDSAGGGLVLHTLRELKEHGKVAAVNAAVMLSPWVSPFNLGALSLENAQHDILSEAILKRWSASLSQDRAQATRAADFSEASFIGFPPMYIQAAGAELFKGQVDALVRRLRADRVDTAYDVFPGQFHVFQTLAPLVPEADRALALIAKKIGQFD